MKEQIERKIKQEIMDLIVSIFAHELDTRELSDVDIDAIDETVKELSSFLVPNDREVLKEEYDSFMTGVTLTEDVRKGGGFSLAKKLAWDFFEQHALLTPVDTGDYETIRLVPVTVFGAEDGYGLCDAVSAWSDCNRAYGKIYRVDDPTFHREKGDTVEVLVKKTDRGFFDRVFDKSEEPHLQQKDSYPTQEVQEEVNTSKRDKSGVRDEEVLKKFIGFVFGVCQPNKGGHFGLIDDYVREFQRTGGDWTAISGEFAEVMGNITITSQKEGKGQTNE